MTNKHNLVLIRTYNLYYKNIFICDKKENEIIIIEVGITSQDNLQLVETEKKRKYDFSANELGLAKTRIIPYILIGVVTKYHKYYIKELNLTPTIEAYIQSITLKKTLETISLEYRRSIEDEMDRMEEALERLGDATVVTFQQHAIEQKHE